MTTRITTDNITDATIGIADLASSVPLNTQWQAVKTGNFTAVAGEGYFVNTTSTAITVTLPASPSAGDVVVLKDYARTWNTNNVTIASALIDGGTTTTTFSTNGQTVTLVYMDGTRGWSLINEDTTTNLGPSFIAATGGTVTTSGDYKIHTFTGDGCFVVSSLGSNIPCAQASIVDYLVVAGGGASGDFFGAGGGAGGFRESIDSTVNSPHTASPLAATTGITVTTTTYPITVGGGGACVERPGVKIGNPGSNSVFSTITSAGGGGGGGGTVPGTPTPGQPGGSGGGGGGYGGTSGTGNTPPTSPPQGNPGGASPTLGGSGGGGATQAGANTGPGGGDTKGGDGAGTGINPSPTVGTPGPSPSLRYFAGGGAGSSTATVAVGGGGGGPGSGYNSPLSDGVANTGGGGANESSSGGKGIVILRYKYQ